jgi:hypothetical protein
MTRTARTLRIEAEEALIRGRVFRVMADRDWELLVRIARMAREDADTAMARTDPARLRLLREGVTRYHLKGLTHMTLESILKALERHGIGLPGFVPPGPRP